jgi:hypothetical protein
MADRLATSLLVGALIKWAESAGGFAAVLAKGDPMAGAVALILTERGGNARFFERAMGVDGLYAWQETSQVTDNQEELSALIARRRRADPDLWILELDIPSVERFAAEINLIG